MLVVMALGLCGVHTALNSGFSAQLQKSKSLSGGANPKSQRLLGFEKVSKTKEPNFRNRQLWWEQNTRNLQLKGKQASEPKRHSAKRVSGDQVRMDSKPTLLSDFERKFHKLHKTTVSLGDVQESQEIADDGKTFEWNGNDDVEDLKSEYNELEIPEESEHTEEESPKAEENPEPQIPIDDLPPPRDPDLDSRSYFEDVDMEIPTEELANEGENLLDEEDLIQDTESDSQSTGKEESADSNLTLVVDSFTELMPNVIPSIEFKGSIINDIISDLVYNIVETRVEEHPKLRTKQVEGEIPKGVSEQEFSGEAGKDTDQGEVKSALVRVLQLVKESNQLREQNSNLNIYKNAHMLHMPMLMKCLMRDSCSVQRKLTSLYTRLFNANRAFRKLVAKRGDAGIRQRRALSFRKYLQSHEFTLTRKTHSGTQRALSLEQNLDLESKENKVAKLDRIDKIVNAITAFFSAKKRALARRLEGDEHVTEKSQPKKGEPEGSEPSKPGMTSDLWGKVRGFFSNLWLRDKRRLEEEDEDPIQDDPIEIVVGNFENEYKKLLSKLEKGFTNEDLKHVTNNYIKLLKIKLIRGMRTGDSVINASTSVLDALRDHLNDNEISMENMDSYLEKVRKIWKDAAEDSINPETSAELKAMVESSRDFQKKVSDKIPEDNALSKRFKSFMSKYQFKLREYGKYLETEENRDKMKQQLNESIDQLIDATEHEKVDKTNVTSLLNDLKNDVNSSLFKSLNEKNLRFILHNAVAAAIQDLDSLENPEKSSNFLFTKSELGDFTNRVIGIIKDLNQDKKKQGVQLHTGVLQKVLASGEDLLDKMGSESKKVDLVKLSKAVLNNIRSANKALEDEEVKAELGELISDYIDYKRIRDEFDVSGIKRSKTYNFLTKDIHVTKSDLPTRLLIQLNQSQLKQAAFLNHEARVVLDFVRKLLVDWEMHHNQAGLETRRLKEIYMILSGKSLRNFKL